MRPSCTFSALLRILTFVFGLVLWNLNPINLMRKVPEQYSQPQRPPVDITCIPEITEELYRTGEYFIDGPLLEFIKVVSRRPSVVTTRKIDEKEFLKIEYASYPKDDSGYFSNSVLAPGNGQMLNQIQLKSDPTITSNESISVYTSGSVFKFQVRKNVNKITFMMENNRISGIKVTKYSNFHIVAFEVFSIMKILLKHSYDIILAIIRTIFNVSRFLKIKLIVSANHITAISLKLLRLSKILFFKSLPIFKKLFRRIKSHWISEFLKKLTIDSFNRVLNAMKTLGNVFLSMLKYVFDYFKKIAAIFYDFISSKINHTVKIFQEKIGLANAFCTIRTIAKKKTQRFTDQCCMVINNRVILSKIFGMMLKAVSNIQKFLKSISIREIFGSFNSHLIWPIMTMFVRGFLFVRTLIQRNSH